MKFHFIAIANEAESFIFLNLLPRTLKIFIMEAAPSVETVYQGVYTLYNNPNSTEKQKASEWLDRFQKSVSFNKIFPWKKCRVKCQKFNLKL